MIHTIETDNFFKFEEPKENANTKDIILFTTNDDEDYFSILLQLYGEYSATHNNFINLKASLTAGEGFSYADADTGSFLDEVNDQETSFDVLQKQTIDFAIFESTALQILYNEFGSIAQIKYIDISKLRANILNSNLEVGTYWYKSDWDDSSEEAIPIPAFNYANGKEDGRQILYVHNHTPGQTYYTLPAYAPAMNSIELDKELNIFALNAVRNGFTAPSIIHVKTALSIEDQAKWTESYKLHQTGPVNANKSMIVFGAEGNMGIDVQTISSEDQGDKYQALRDDVVSNIATAHRGNLDLAGVSTNGADLGGDSNKLITSLEYFKTTVIKPYQRKIVDMWKRILKAEGLNNEIDIINIPMTQLLLGSIDINSVLTAAEKRAAFGLEPLLEEDVKEEIVADEAENIIDNNDN